MILMRSLILLLLYFFPWLALSAGVGDTFDDIKSRYRKPPQQVEDIEVIVSGKSGLADVEQALAWNLSRNVKYIVQFDAKGLSLREYLTHSKGRVIPKRYKSRFQREQFGDSEYYRRISAGESVGVTGISANAGEKDDLIFERSMGLVIVEHRGVSEQLSAMTLGDYLGQEKVKSEDIAISAGDKIYNAAELDELPKLKVKISQDYPTRPKARGITGEVEVHVLVNESGDVVEADITSSTNRLFNYWALQAIFESDFTPGTIEGKRVNFAMPVSLSFNAVEKVVPYAGRSIYETTVSMDIEFELETLPKPAQTVQPIYPDNLRRAGISGSALIVFEVDEIGNVLNASVESETHEGFGRSALEAVKMWKFEPGTMNGKPVNVPMQIRLAFKLN